MDRNCHKLEAQVSLYRSPELNKPPLEISANKNQQLLQYILSHSGLKNVDLYNLGQLIF